MLDLVLQGPPYEVQSNFLVAADGASSRVRKQLGIALLGNPAMQHLVNIHFFSRDMAQRLRQQPAMLYFVFNSQAIVVLVAHNLKEGEFVAQVSCCNWAMHALPFYIYFYILRNLAVFL